MLPKEKKSSTGFTLPNFILFFKRSSHLATPQDMSSSTSALYCKFSTKKSQNMPVWLKKMVLA
jgi:hypothetical protein